MGKLVFAPIGMLVLCIGVWMIWWTIDARIYGAASENWPTTTAFVKTSEYHERQSDEGASRYLDIEYEYVVRDEWYRSDHIQFGGVEPDSEKAALSRVYTVDAEIDVYYDPANPARAVLRPGVPPSWGWAILQGLFLILFGCGWIAGGIQMDRQR